MSAQRVMAFLALGDRAVQRSHIAASLWIDASDVRAHASLRSALWRLRSGGGALVNVSDGGAIGLSPAVAIDVRESLSVANKALSPSEAWDPVESDVASLCADVLPDWYEDWVLIERERFRQLRMHALEAACARLTALGRFGLAVQAGLAAVAAEPLRESAHRVLILAYLAEGNSGEALRQYEGFRELLHTELDLEPSQLMEDLVRDVKR